MPKAPARTDSGGRQLGGKRGGKTRQTIRRSKGFEPKSRARGRSSFQANGVRFERIRPERGQSHAGGAWDQSVGGGRKPHENWFREAKEGGFAKGERSANGGLLPKFTREFL